MSWRSKMVEDIEIRRVIDEDLSSFSKQDKQTYDETMNNIRKEYEEEETRKRKILVGRKALYDFYLKKGLTKEACLRKAGATSI